MKFQNTTMKKLYFLVFALLIKSILFSQQISIGTGTAVANSPWNPFYGFSYVQTIYLASEIAANGSITNIQFYYNGAALDLSDDVTVYLGVTSKSIFSSGSDWVPIANLTQVYSGVLTGYTIPGWITITLPTAFPYSSASGNLVVAIDENKTGDNGSSRFAGTSLNTNRVLGFASDATNPNPSAPPLGTTSSTFANIRINGLNISPCQPLSLLTQTNATTTSITATWQAPTSGTPPTQYNYEVRTSGGPGSGATGLISSGNSPTTNVTVSGLLASSTYTLYVRPDCGAGSTGAWASIQVNTLYR